MGLILAALGIASLLTHRHALARFGAMRRAEMLLALPGPILICAVGAILFGGTLLESGRRSMGVCGLNYCTRWKLPIKTGAYNTQPAVDSNRQCNQIGVQ
jgi:hypothetical protein